MQQGGSIQLSPEMQQCIQLCHDCETMCQLTLMYCLGQGGTYAEAAHIRLLLDCIAICQICTGLMARDSDFAGRSCTLCADLCDRCAASCEQFTGDAQLAACAQTCRRCAESCRAMGT